MKSEKIEFRNEIVITFKNQLLRYFLKIFFVGVSCVISITTTAQADNREFFEKWKTVESFDVGYGCNWTRSTPGPESLFEINKLKAARIIKDLDSIDFRLIKSKSTKTSANNLVGSMFAVRLDKKGKESLALRIQYPFSKHGACAFIIKATDGSIVDLINNSQFSDLTPNDQVTKWVADTISDCHRRIKKARDLSNLLDCALLIKLSENDVFPSDGLYFNITPDAVVPASVARVYLRNRGKIFAITTFDDEIQIEEVAK